MAKLHKLTDTQCRSAVCTTGTVRKLADGGGLYLWIGKDGSRRWRYRYHVGGKEKLLSCGTYPDTTLKAARDKAAELRLQTDPGQARKAVKQAKTIATANDFEAVATAWLAEQKHFNPKYRHDTTALFTNHVFQHIGKTPISALMSADLIPVIKGIGASTVQRRLLSLFTRVFQYAIARSRDTGCTHNPTDNISNDELKKHVVKKHPRVTDKELPELLRKIDAYESEQTRLALKLLFLVFTRANELLRAEWSEIDFDEALWHIPGERLKMRLPLLVPLTPQAIAILKRLKEIGCGSPFVFPGRTHEKPLTSQALLLAFGKMGYAGDQTSHGIRHIASSTLNEAADEDSRPLFSADAIERQLAHVPESIRGVYNEAQYLPMRRKIMAYWADYLDIKIKEGI